MIAPEQDIQKLLEDLVYQNSRQWNFNKYHKGSLKNVSILSKDLDGRPQKVKGSYTFSGFGGTKNGSVTLVFNNKGLPTAYISLIFQRPVDQQTEKLLWHMLKMIMLHQ